MKLSNTTKGILLIILAAFSFASMNTLVKLAGDIPFIQKTFFRNSIPLIISTFFLLKSKTQLSIKKENIPLLLLRSTCGTIGVMCNFYAVDNLILSDVSMLGKLAPFFAIIMSFFILKEKVSPFRVVTVIVAFIGSIFIVNPDLTAISPSFPALIAVLGAFAAGCAYTIVRKLGERGQDATSIVFFFSAFSTIVVAPVFFGNHYPMSVSQTFLLIGAGIFATVGQFAVTNAYIYAPAKRISVYDYSQVLFAAIYGFFLYAEVPSSNSIIGYIIIIGIGITSFLYSRRKN